MIMNLNGTTEYVRATLLMGCQLMNTRFLSCLAITTTKNLNFKIDKTEVPQTKL